MNNNINLSIKDAEIFIYKKFIDKTLNDFKILSNIDINYINIIKLNKNMDKKKNIKNYITFAEFNHKISNYYLISYKNFINNNNNNNNNNNMFLYFVLIRGFLLIEKILTYNIYINKSNIIKIKFFIIFTFYISLSFF